MRTSVFVLAMAALASAAMPASAQGTMAQRAACTPDVMRLCSDDIPNVDRIVVCLRRERTKLSTSCRGVFDTLDGQKTATRAVTIVGATPATAWCQFGADSPAGQDAWRAWCSEMGR